MRVRFSRAAEADLDDIFFYIAQDRPLSAASMVKQLLDAVAGLADFPMIGRPSGGLGERELTTVYPYVIVYVVRAHNVEITRIHHGAKNR